MQPTDQKAASAFSILRALPTVPTTCLLLFALAIVVPFSGTATGTASWIVLFSALLSSIAGFAFSPIAGAFLFRTLSEPLAVVKILLVASIAQQLYCVWRLRETIRLRECAPYLVGSVTTLPIGLYLLCDTSASIFLPLLGALLITYGIFSALKPDLRAGRNPVWGRVLSGALGGITGGLAAFPAAFVTMWCLIQGFDKHQTRSIVQPFILINQLLSISVLMAVRPTQIVPFDALRYAAPAVLGAYFGLMIFNRVDTSTFNRIVGLFLIAAGLGFVRPL
ncbi:sulfite exporter TauE/SafE family protein [Bradyrhizobium diazoefficiens]|uniref:sulfite exporter TauE/SafE family protein n=1 Tax=Bradyrhizobium diazoefficiens TaxID=1355477 RepID=UPI00190D9D07|nr:sulfite exporter TauE/SafE family protein [Bradyrhizobium diazoefficiens]MBK3664769.1 sulfite exporter TauE/SafE family protein [Bradyrhizobium diazoefficiens]